MIRACTVLGQPAMALRAADGAEATVLLHGAQVVSWVPAGDQERLYLSPQAVAGPGAAVRGGIPLIFPQFNQRGPLPRHGLVRDRAWQWQADEAAERDGAAIGVLRLDDDAASRALWPQRFCAELTLAVGGLGLDLELAITNTGDSAWPFHAALHTYFRVDDLRRTRLKGLFGTTYEDMLDGGKPQRQEFDPQSFVGAIDRLYRAVPWPLTLASGLGHLLLDSAGFADAVVWNPGPAGAAALADLPDEDWTAFLCIEAAQVADPVTLAPGETWVARHTLSA